MKSMQQDKKTTDKLEQLKKAYSSPTWWYDLRGFFILTFTYNDSLFYQIKFFSENTYGLHLEAAIGTGTLVKIIELYNVYFRKKKPMTGIGFDYSPDMLAGAKAKLENSHFKIIYADAAHLSYSDCSFDTINLANSIHCFPEVDPSLKELFRVLKGAGKFYLNVLVYPDRNTFLGRIAYRINQWGQKKGILYTPYEEKEIITKIKLAGFKIVSVSKSGNSLNIIAEKTLV